MMKIFVISHKRIDCTLVEPHIPIYVGAAGLENNVINDRTLENIADKNPNYCELTAQYWIWKNWLPKTPSNEFVGFCHYRRFFSPDKRIQNIEQVSEINSEKIVMLLQTGRADVILPKKLNFRVKQHWFSYSKKWGVVKFPWQNLTIREYYELNHSLSDLLLAIDLLPIDHKERFEKYLESRSISPFNMVISNKDNLSDYFDVLFPWLFEVEKNIDLSNKSPHQARLFGFIAERFCSYYFEKFHRPAYIPVSFLE